jgi:ATP-binding cassette, subfamily B, bacterial
MNPDLSHLTWPVSRLSDAIEGLARKSELALQPATMPTASTPLDDETLGDWIEAAASWVGLEAEAVTTSYDKVMQVARRAGPALLRLTGAGPTRFLALLRGKRGKVCVLGPDFAVSWVKPQAIRDALCLAMETGLSSKFDGVLQEAGIPENRRDQLLSAMLGERLRGQPISGCWMLRLSPGAGFSRHLQQAHLLRRLGMLAASHTAEYFLWVLSWWVIGRAALEGRFDYGWLLGWALLLLTLVPCRLLTTWLQGRIAIGGGVLLKQRMLYGALRLHPDEIRHQGAGQFLGRVIESQAVESLALGGGFLAAVSILELIVALLILAAGAGGALHVVLLAAWVGVALLLAWRYALRRHDWTEARLGMTHDLVERMVGHRTRLAQESPGKWHVREDQDLEGYLNLSAKMDRVSALFTAALPRGWLVVALLGLIPSFVFGAAPAASVAIALGGILLAYQALKRLAAGLRSLADAAISWRKTAPLFQAADRQPVLGLPSFAVSAEVASPVKNGQRREVVQTHDLVFRHAGRGEAVLRRCSVSIRSGDRILLEGGSGSGKSTFASLLIGLRAPNSGLLLLDGVDRQTLGEDGWRRRIVAAPQFHENHVLTETFAFNLLMGKRWPPSPHDLQEAETLCRELGLGELLERMPAGLQQMVGETGWQLSQGERSRLFIARALLQDAETIILDESFAALDPETMGRVLQCVETRASTLLVIAHP